MILTIIMVIEVTLDWFIWEERIEMRRTNHKPKDRNSKIEKREAITNLLK